MERITIEKCVKCGETIKSDEPKWFLPTDENEIVCEDCYMEYLTSKKQEKPLTVQQLIDELMTVENKSLPVYVYDKNSDISPVKLVDTSISDRVDLNII